MKKLLVIPIALLILSSCNHAALEQAYQTNDSLKSLVEMHDTALESFITSFNEIESSLDSIVAKQHIIALFTDNKHNDFNGYKKAHINAEIAAINQLMDKNRLELAHLKKKSNTSIRINKLLSKTIKTLTSQLSQKEYELCELNLKLDAMRLKVTKLEILNDSLSDNNYIQKIIINYQSADLHTSFYIIGTTDELKNKKIIDRKGGVLGIGRTSELKKDFDDNRFTQISSNHTTSIPVNGKDIKLITNHPSDSYTLTNNESKKNWVNSIEITNPEKFWSVSKYLVVVKK